MDKIILHSDLNNFYASVECLYNPEIRRFPVAVTGCVETRHGIILAKNNLARKFNIQTGEPTWSAQRKCPGLILVPPHFDRYVRFSKMAKEIYSEYTDRVESFGLDECWLDVSNRTTPPTGGTETADTIRNRIKSELGLTVSIGVSYNKIFAKLGSDMKKPDATTAITRENFRETVWKLPVYDLLYVGRATYKKLKNLNIDTIGSLACANPKMLYNKLGKNGITLWQFANGYDLSPVARVDEPHLPKSVSHSTTTPHDLTSEEEVKIIMYVLSESIAARLREQGLTTSCIQLSIRDNELYTYERQGQFAVPLNNAAEIFQKAFELYKTHHTSQKPIRSIGISACKLSKNEYKQLSLFPDVNDSEKNDRLERSIDAIRKRFGHHSVARGIMLANTGLSNFNPKEEPILHPIGFFK